MKIEEFSEKGRNNMKQSITKKIIIFGLLFMITIGLLISYTPVSAAENSSVGTSFNIGPYTVTLTGITSEKITDIDQRVATFVATDYDNTTGNFAVRFSLKGSAGYENSAPAFVFPIEYPGGSCRTAPSAGLSPM